MLANFRKYKELKEAQFVIGLSRYPQSHKYFLYRHFHSHLPEDLFFEDFTQALKASNRISFKAYSKAFREIDAHSVEKADTESDVAAKLRILEKVVMEVTCAGLVSEDDPVV